MADKEDKEIKKPELTDKKIETEPETKLELPEAGSVVEAGDTPNTIKTDLADEKRSKLASWKQAYLSNKKISIPVTILVLILIILAIPFTRYSVLGLFMKQQYSVMVLDSTSGGPITNANISLGGGISQTDNKGKAVVTSKLGSNKLLVTKKYYNEYSEYVTVPLKKSSSDHTVKLVANGRQVPVVVVNKISNVGMENATVKAGESEAKTDNDGKAIIVLSPNESSAEAVITAKGFNDTKVTIKITEQADSNNTFSVTPSGKLYFLSKASGKIDVVKTNLDGTDRSIVLKGTGKESETDTVLLASRDWKYFMLNSHREGDKAKLYLIDATNGDKVTTADEGNAEFTLVGWVNHNFVYKVTRNNIKDWQPKKNAIKSFNADNKQLATHDDTSATGNENNYATEGYGWISAIGSNQVMFYKQWNAVNDTSETIFSKLTNKKNQVVALTFGQSVSKTTLQSYSLPTKSIYYTSYFSPLNSYSYALYEPDELFFAVEKNSSNLYYEVKNNKVTTSSEAKEFLDSGKNYPTFLQSPNGSKAFWSESRDGKNTLFIGKADGSGGNIIASLSPYKVYGWYTDDYLLVSKDGSELYIMSVSGGKALKITDYHKPDQSYYGYGGGYGGL